MPFLQPSGYPKRDEQEVLPYWVDVQADLNLLWSYRSCCRFFHELAQMVLRLNKKKNIYLYTLLSWTMSLENFKTYDNSSDGDLLYA